MGRGGGFRGGGGGGGRGSGRFGSSSLSSSSSHCDSKTESNSVVRGAAASRGSRSYFDRWWSGPVGVDALRCRDLVKTYELLAIESRKRGGKDSSVSQSYLKKLEDSCAEYKEYWIDWWSTDKESFIELFVNKYNECVKREGLFRLQIL